MAENGLQHLYPMLSILADALARAGTPCQALGQAAARLRGARMFRAGAALREDIVYVLRPQDAERFPAGPYVCAVTRPAAAGAGRLLCLNRTADEVLDALLEQFGRYQDMESRLDGLVYANGSLQAVCALGAELLGNPLCVHDDWFVMVARSAELEKVLPPDYIMTSSREFLPRIIVEDFKNDTEYLETYLSRSAQLWDAKPRCLYVNLWEGSVYRGRLLVAEYRRAFIPEDAMVREVLAQQVMLLMRRGQPDGQRAYRGTDDIVLDLLNNVRPEAQEEARFLSLLGWGRDDLLVLVRLAAQQEGAGVMQEHALHSDLFQAFPRSYVLFAGHQQVVVMNLTRDPVSMPMLRHALSPLCRDYCLYAGISSPVRGPGELHTADRQARAALDRVFQLRSEKWILAFPDCALDYMLSRAQREIEPRGLVAPELLKLMNYDRENDTQYFKTLRTYLIEERDIPRTAQALIIHRTTLQYRLKKIRAIVPLDMDDPWRRLYLLMSLWILEA